ncbi:MAG: non-reducing end alpha-L-arabinofuranosidase family hydrolase [Victivallaceae bacterium]
MVRSAASLKGLGTASPVDLETVWHGSGEQALVAPQVFFNEFDGFWYLVGQRRVVNRKISSLPVFSRTRRLNDIASWSKPESMCDEVTFGDNHPYTAIDFWVIYDFLSKCFRLFYADQCGGIRMFSASVTDFPYGWSDGRRVIQEQYGAESWELHEAGHVYYLADRQCWFMLVEGIRSRSSWADYLNRFMLAYRTDRLDGEWTRINGRNSPFWLEREDIFSNDGYSLHQVSHPEFVRDDPSQTMTIDCFAELLIQETCKPFEKRIQYCDLEWRLRLLAPDKHGFL